jgi:hypothetical protein
MPAGHGAHGTLITGSIQDSGTPQVGQIQVEEREGIAAAPARNTTLGSSMAMAVAADSAPIFSPQA